MILAKQEEEARQPESERRASLDRVQGGTRDRIFAKNRLLWEEGNANRMGKLCVGLRPGSQRSSTNTCCAGEEVMRQCGDWAPDRSSLR